MSFFNGKQKPRYHFGKTSTARLVTCEADIQKILNETIRFTNFSVVSGHRTEEEQNKLYPKYSKVKFPDSYHNAYPSQAVDVAPYIAPYGAIVGSTQQIKEISVIAGISEAAANNFVLKAYARLMGQIERVAFDLDIPIVLGMDWDMDYDMTDQTFHDLGHIQLSKK